MAWTADDYLELGKWVYEQIGGFAAGAAQGRIAEGNLEVSQGELALLGYRYANDANLQRYLAQVRAGELELDQRRFGLEATDARANQVMRGDIMANIQDVVATGLPEGVPDITFTGGVRPSLLGPNSRAFGREMSRQALLNQMPGGTGVGTGLSAPPSGPAGRENRAGDIATRPPEDVSGTISPLVGGNVVPAGNQFSSLGGPPAVTGFGGPADCGYANPPREGQFTGTRGGSNEGGFGALPLGALAPLLGRLRRGGRQEIGADTPWGPPENLMTVPEEMGPEAPQGPPSGYDYVSPEGWYPGQQEPQQGFYGGFESVFGGGSPRRHQTGNVWDLSPFSQQGTQAGFIPHGRR